MSHPDYIGSIEDWTKWRRAYVGGRSFIEAYLRKFSTRETNAEFLERKSVTYCPRFAGAAVDDVKNSIYQRLVDIVREGGTLSYRTAQRGEEGGVNLRGDSMTSFFGIEILPELLVLRQVGVFVDMPSIEGSSLASAVGARPYIYKYCVEDIINWEQSQEPGYYDRIVLRDNYIYNDSYGYPKERRTSQRELWKEGGKVYARLTDCDGKVAEPITLSITKIPFVLVEISNSLMQDIADCQVALLNMTSSDIGFILKANFPFYVEQVGNQQLIQDQLKNSVESPEIATNEIDVGTVHGRRYGPSMDKPGFINPSSEPITASMAKEEQIKEEIRLLLNLSISNLRPNKVSAESKNKDGEGLNSGLSYIGLTLEKAERQIAELWSMYEGSDDIARVSYPTNYELRTTSSRIDEANSILDIVNKVPSKTFKQECFKLVNRVLFGNISQANILQKISSELDNIKYLSSDAKEVRSDVEGGYLSKELAAEIRAYPPDTAEVAKKEHMERLAYIHMTQTQGITPDHQIEPVTKNTDTTFEDSTDPPVRGEGK